MRLLRSAARLEPSQAEHAAAVARVRASLDASGPATPHERRGRWRLAAGIAAAVGIVVLAAVAVMVATRPRTAWAQLQAAAEASGQFRGWVSVRADLPNARPFMVFDTERLSRAEFRPADNKGRRAVRFMDHRRSTDSFWSPDAGTIFVGELSPAELELTYERYAKHFNQAVDFREQLKNMREALGAGNLDVRSERDGGLDRFNMDWFLRDAGGKRQSTPVDAMFCWVDPKTHLIIKVRHAQRGQQPSTLVYEYNHPIVNDIYDLGVPRDAKVVDRRPTGALKDRLDALDRRIATGTGDGVAVITTVTRAPDAAAAGGPVLDTLEIYAQSGDRWMWAQFLVGREKGRDPTMNGGQQPQLAPPPGWPKLEPAAAVALVKDVRPDDLFVRDRERSFRSFKGSKVLATGDPASVQDSAYFGVPGRYWPGRFRLRMYYSLWLAASLRQDADDAETVIVDELDDSAKTRQASRQVTVTKRTGVPTAAVTRVFDGAGVERMTERWTFTSNLRTAAGTVLPERWTYEARFAPPEKRSYRTESTLRFEVNTRVPDTWFEPPRRRFESK